MDFNILKTASLGRLEYLGWSTALVVLFAAISPLVHFLAAITGNQPIFGLIYIFAFGGLLSCLAFRRIEDLDGQAEIWTVPIVVSTFCFAAPLYSTAPLGIDVVNAIYTLAFATLGAVHVTLLLLPGAYAKYIRRLKQEKRAMEKTKHALILQASITRLQHEVEDLRSEDLKGDDLKKAA